MNKTLLGIEAGLKAAAKAFTKDDCHFRVGPRRIVCPICGHDEFDQRSMLMNTTGLTMMGLDWLNTSACALVCRRCTRIEFFVDAPADDSRSVRKLTKKKSAAAEEDVEIL